MQLESGAASGHHYDFILGPLLRAWLFLALQLRTPASFQQPSDRPVLAQ